MSIPPHPPPSPPSTEMKTPKSKHRKKRKTQVVKEKKYILRRRRRCMTRKCSLCGKKFASTQALNIHVTDEHEYKFLCKFRKCRSEYSSQTLADRHTRHHSPPRYQCEHCGKQFHEKYVLEAYTNVHTEKGYECTYPKCHCIYKSPAKYNRHLKKHSSSRPSSKCSVCDQSFKEKNYLDEYMKIHSDELTEEYPTAGKVQMEIKCANSHQNEAPRFGQKDR